MFSFTLMVSFIGLGLVLAVKEIVSRRSRNPRRLPLPPGPKGLPLFGNIFDLPHTFPWEGFNQLCQEYGDIIHFKGLVQEFIVLGSRRRAADLLNKRAASYSDRPVQPILEMMDLHWNLGSLPYGVKWRQQRRELHQYLNNNAVRKYHPIMNEETKLFLQKVRSNPDHIFTGLQNLIGATIMRATYGFDDINHHQSLVHDAEKLLQEFFEAMIPGRYLMDYFPMIRYLPSWLPGAGFKKKFRDVAHLSSKLRIAPFEEAKCDMERGRSGNHPSMAHSLIDQLQEEVHLIREGQEEVSRNVCAVAYLAGTDSTVSSATALIYALSSYPEVQTKGQAEIDEVIGSDRLPLVSDREKLPYVHAIVKEVSRWHTVFPLGVAHTNTEDDEYDGYFIPKGTFILQNNWAIMHDPDIFDRPFEFIPERYITSGKTDPLGPDPDVAAFGYGRRICPGRYFSNDALFLLTASLLSTFSITAPKDKYGKVVPMQVEPKSSLISKPRPFKCEIRSRPGREHLLE